MFSCGFEGRYGSGMFTRQDPSRGHARPLRGDALIRHVIKVGSGNVENPYECRTDLIEKSDSGHEHLLRSDGIVVLRHCFSWLQDLLISEYLRAKIHHARLSETVSLQLPFDFVAEGLRIIRAKNIRRALTWTSASICLSVFPKGQLSQAWDRAIRTNRTDILRGRKLSRRRCLSIQARAKTIPRDWVQAQSEACQSEIHVHKTKQCLLDDDCLHIAQGSCGASVTLLSSLS